MDSSAPRHSTPKERRSERRLFARVQPSDTWLSVPGPKRGLRRSRTVEARIVELSAGGLSFAPDPPVSLAIDEDVHVDFEGRPCLVRIRSVRHDGDQVVYGTEFVRVTRSLERRAHQFLERDRTGYLEELWRASR